LGKNSWHMSIILPKNRLFGEAVVEKSFLRETDFVKNPFYNCHRVSWNSGFNKSSSLNKVI